MNKRFDCHNKDKTENNARTNEECAARRMNYSYAMLNYPLLPPNHLDNPMIRKTISMPDEMNHWICDRIKSGLYNNDSEYFRDLIRQDQEKENAQKQLQTLLNEAENSGISERSLDDIWSEAEASLQDNNG